MSMMKKVKVDACEEASRKSKVSRKLEIQSIAWDIYFLGPRVYMIYLGEFASWNGVRRHVSDAL